MTKTAFVLAALTSVMLAAPTVRAEDTVVVGHSEQQLGWRREHAEKVRGEISMHRQRARELEPILARDRQARHDVEVDWVVLERHAREMRVRAAEFHAVAAEAGDEFGHDLNAWAGELENAAQRDEQNAQAQHGIAQQLDGVIASADAARNWHLDHARRMEEWLRRHSF